MKHTSINEQLLASVLLVWFREADTSGKDFWSRNVVGRVLKEELGGKEHWKNRPRGNPMKGYQAAKMGKAQP